MADKDHSVIASLLRRAESDLLDEWFQELAKQSSNRELMTDRELRAQCSEFLRLLQEAAQAGIDDPDAAHWARVRTFLSDISTSRAQQGFSSVETATFVLSLKRPLFSRLRAEVKKTDQMAEEVWRATELIDRLGLFTIQTFLKSREAVIIRQQHEMLELSTPVVKLWDGVLALPLIGTLDSNRTQIVMESLLERIVETNSEIAIIDITGVPTVDTLVAQHLMKTVAAAKLMGVDCIISGIRPQIAQTIVHLGVALGDVITKASLADAFRLALSRIGSSVQLIRSPTR